MERTQTPGVLLTDFHKEFDSTDLKFMIQAL